MGEKDAKRAVRVLHPGKLTIPAHVRRILEEEHAVVAARLDASREMARPGLTGPGGPQRPVDRHVASA